MRNPSSDTQCMVVGVVAVLVATLCGCTPPPAPQRLPPNSFLTSGATTLCFDLGTPAALPAAGLVFHVQPDSIVEPRNVILPFPTVAVQPCQAVRATSGTYDRYTIISYHLGPGAQGDHSFGVTPIFDTAEEGDFYREHLPGRLYLLAQERSLERRFYYRYPTPDDQLTPYALPSLPNLETISALCVRLPRSAKILHDTCGAMQPLREATVDGVSQRLYAGTAVPPAKGTAVDIVFLRPPTKPEKLIFQYGLKLFGAILTPLVGIAILTSERVRSRRARRLVLLFGGLLETFVLLGLGYYAFRFQEIAGLEPFFDVAVLVIGATFSVLLAVLTRPKT